VPVPPTSTTLRWCARKLPRAAEAEVVDILGQRQLGDGDLILDRARLLAASPFVVLPLSEVDTLVIEGGLPEELIGIYRRSTLTLVETFGAPV
jgi:hypothetical protein